MPYLRFAAKRPAIDGGSLCARRRGRRVPDIVGGNLLCYNDFALRRNMEEV